MKKGKSVIKKSDRSNMAMNPFYEQCAMTGILGHFCGGGLTWEHAIIFAGKKIQKPWAIIPLCDKAHATGEFQDAGTIEKELNVWIALNMATDEELLEISKAENYIQKRTRLNRIYGVYEPRVPLYKTVGIKY